MMLMSELEGFITKPCRADISCEFIPKKKMELSLEGVSKKLRDRGILIDLETPFLIMFAVLGKKVTLFKSGKMLIKELRDKDRAREIAQRTLELIK